MSFYTNSRYPRAEDGTSRVASSRQSTRASDIDFDQLPSHRPRKSGANGAAPGPSSLSQSYLPDPEPDDDHDQGGMDGGFEDYGPPENDDYAPQNTPRRASFTQIDQDEDEDEELDNGQADAESPTRKLSKGKGGGRSQIPDTEEQQADQEMEDAIAQGLDDVELDAPSEDEDQQPRSKKLRIEKPKSKTPRGRSEKKEKVIKERSCTSSCRFLGTSLLIIRSSNTSWRTSRSTASLPSTRMVATREGCVWQYR